MSIVVVAEDAFPKRVVNREAGSAGRPRQPNPFDEHVSESYGEWANDPDGKAGTRSVNIGIDDSAKVIARIRAAAEFLGCGVDTAVGERDGDTVVYFRARDKRERKSKSE